MSDADKLYEIDLPQPFRTNDVIHGAEKRTVDGVERLVFTGKAKVTKEVYEDLERRKHEYEQSNANVHRDQGNNKQVYL